MADAGETTQTVDGQEKETGLHDPVSGFAGSAGDLGGACGTHQINGITVTVNLMGPSVPANMEKKIIDAIEAEMNTTAGKAATKGFLEKNTSFTVNVYDQVLGGSQTRLDGKLTHGDKGEVKNNQNIQIDIDLRDLTKSFETGIPGAIREQGKSDNGKALITLDRILAHEMFGHGYFGTPFGYGYYGHIGKGYNDLIMEMENGIMMGLDPDAPSRWGYGMPIVLDLDSDGLDLVAIDKSKAMYDIDGDGYLENVGWVGDGDGFLSIDLNGDGLIVDPKELAFALSTDDPNDTDLQGLAATYDSNQDGVLDAKDAEFAKFKVWIDIDQDGACDAGEVKTLADVGITSVNLTSDNKEQVIAGNKVYGTTTYSKTDGTTGKVGDVGLATSAAGWKREEVTGGIKFNYEGTGSNAGKSLFEAAAATALIMDVGASGLIGAMGAELDDSLSTSGKEDVILGGGAGNDKIKGGDGNDWLAGGEGIDSMNGGKGDDLLIVDADDDFKNIDGGAGWDRVVYLGDQNLNLNITDYNVEFFQAGDGNDVIQTDLTIQTDLDGGARREYRMQQWKNAA